MRLSQGGMRRSLELELRYHVVRPIGSGSSPCGRRDASHFARRAIVALLLDRIDVRA